MRTKKILITEEDIQNAKKNTMYFEKIYRAYINEIFSYAAYILRNKMLAEDVTSETFLKAIKNFKKFKGKPETLRSWLYAICRNIAFTSLKRNKKFIFLEENKLEDFQDFSQEDFNDNQFSLWQEIGKLDYKTREILTLKYKTDLSSEEIAKLVKMKKENIRKIISRAVKKLKQILQNE